MLKFNEHPLAGKNDIDSAFSSGWAFYKKWFLPMYAISFVLSVIVATLTSKIDISSFQYTSDFADISTQLRSMMGVYAITALVSLLFNTLLQYFIVFKPIDPNFSLADAFVSVLVKFYLPLLVIYIILGIFAVVAMTLGIVLLFIGLLFALPYVLLFMAMATPIIMVENCSIDGTLKRLFQLVHRRFWQNMGWISIYLILIIAVSMLISALTMLPFSGSMIKSFTDPEAGARLLEIATNPAYVIISSLASALTAPILPILGLILYFNNAGTANGGNIDSGHNDGDSNGDVKVEDLYSDNRNENFSPTVDDLSP